MLKTIVNLETIVTSSVLILIVVGLRFLLGNRISRRLRYALWSLVLLRLLLPTPYIQSPISVMNAINTREVEIAAAVRLPVFPTGTVTGPYYIRPEGDYQPTLLEPEEQPTTTLTWARMSVRQIVTLLWQLGAIVVALWFITINQSLHSKLREKRRPYQNVSCALPLYSVALPHAPCLYGLFRPAIYLTPGVLQSEDSVRHVLTHEMTHYRHGDHIWSFLRLVCLCVYWFNPLVWLAAWLSRTDCELACDESAVILLGEENRIAYGRTLLDLVACGGTAETFLCATTTMTSDKAGLKKRLNMIVRNKKTSLPALIAVLLLVLMTMACTFGSAWDGRSDLDQEIEAELNDSDSLVRAAIDLLESSFIYENGDLWFRFPQYPDPQEWFIHISGRARMGDGAMSVHLFSEESENRSWLPGEYYCIPFADSDYLDLVMDITLPNAMGGEFSKSIDLLQYVVDHDQYTKRSQ